MKYLEDFKLYLETLNYAPQSISHYVLQLNILNQKALFLFNKELSEISSRDFLRILKEFDAIYSKNTLNNFTSITKQYFNYLVTFEDKRINIITNAMFVKTEQNKINYISVEELKEILKYADSLISRVSIIALYGAGLRIAELENIERTEIEINYTETGKKIYFNLKNTKNRYPRLAPFFPIEELETDPEFSFEYFLKYSSYELSEKDCPFSAVRYRIYKILKKYNEENNTNFTIHDFRRSYATNRSREGIPLELLAKLMGHKSITTTLLYIYQTESEIRALIN